MKQFLSLLFISFIVGCTPMVPQNLERAKGFEKEIQQLESRDKAENYPDNAILFVGSSSIRLWDNIAADMAPYPVIKRGFGGAKSTDLLYFTERLVYPHEFRALAIFIANDISNVPEDNTPKEIVSLFDAVIKKVRVKNPAKPIFIIAITPNNSRWEVWSEAKQANELLEAYCNKNKNVYFIDTVDGFLGTDGKPRTELFRDDQLHLKQVGYDIWAKKIKERMNEVLK